MGTEPERVTPDAHLTLAESRSYYEQELELGVDRFFGEELRACPWCESSAIRHRITTSDLRQFKPGRFTLDECQDCGHLFQNPPLSDEGLSFYYRDTYDGLNAERIEANLSSMVPINTARAETLRSLRPDQPRRWLDVGTASAHFCEVAAGVFPGTVFDGLDMSDGVLAGQRAGRIESAYQGQLPALSSTLAGRYDQVSMIHYLEHARDPLAELDAVVEVLQDGGWVLIEQPDPQARSARIFGSWWAGWNQPEHLHMITADNLTRALQDRGFEIIDVVRRAAHVPLETFVLLATVVNKTAPRGDEPWRGPRPRFARLRRAAAMAVFVALMPMTLLVDRVILPRLLHSYHAYRIVARLQPQEPGPPPSKAS